MVLKIHESPLKVLLGVTLVELLLVISLLGILITTTISINSGAYRAKARDERRLSDLSTIERVITEYMLDNKAYPGTADTIYTSTSLPLGHSGDLSSASNGWFPVDVSNYASHINIDPVNDTSYFYIYRHNSLDFELNAVLENLLDEATSDNGDDNQVYEVGSDLTIL